MAEEARPWERGYSSPTPPALPGSGAQPGFPEPLSPEAPQAAPRPAAAQPDVLCAAMQRGLRPQFRRRAAICPPPGWLGAAALPVEEQGGGAEAEQQEAEHRVYWRQISRPTSSRRRCFSFSPNVRTQGAISVGVAEAALQTEAEVEATPHQPPASPPPGRAADPDRRRPADGPPAAAAQSPAHGLRRACATAPPSACGSAVRRVRRHPAQRLSVPLLSPRVGATRRPPVEGPIPQLPALFGNRGEAAAPSNRLYCGGKTEGCARAQEKLQPPAAVGPCLRDSLSSRAAGDCSLCDATPSTLHASTP